ncbi:MAG TPA: LapA family protein [Acidimicrobiia bacterium]|nr:LapA family protein [Acidimicrobiia bacterium]
MTQEVPRSTPTNADGRRIGGGAIASIVGIGALIIFIVQNTEDVRLDFLFLHFTWPLWLLTIVSALLGALVWFGLGVIRRRRRRKERRQDRRD